LSFSIGCHPKNEFSFIIKQAEIIVISWAILDFLFFDDGIEQDINFLKNQCFRDLMSFLCHFQAVLIMVSISAYLEFHPRVSCAFLLELIRTAGSPARLSVSMTLNGKKRVE